MVFRGTADFREFFYRGNVFRGIDLLSSLTISDREILSMPYLIRRGCIENMST